MSANGIPDIPRPRSNDPETQRFYDAVSNAFRSIQRTGSQGLVTYDELGRRLLPLYNDYKSLSDKLNKADGVGCEGASVPAAVSNITTDGAFGVITIKWDVPAYRGHGHTEVWASSTNNFSTAKKAGDSLEEMPYFKYIPDMGVYTSSPTPPNYTGSANTTTNASATAVAVSTNIARATSPIKLSDAVVYFWLRHVSGCGKGEGPWSASVKGTTAPPVDLIGQVMTANANYFVSLLGLDKVVQLATDLDITVGNILQSTERTAAKGKVIYDGIKTVTDKVNNPTTGLASTYSIASGVKVTLGDNGSGLVKKVNDISYNITDPKGIVQSGFTAIRNTIGSVSASGTIVYNIDQIKTTYAKASDLTAYAKTAVLANYATNTALGAYLKKADLSSHTSITGLNTQVSNAYQSLAQGFKQFTAGISSTDGTKGVCISKSGTVLTNSTTESACATAGGVWLAYPNATIQQIADARVGYAANNTTSEITLPASVTVGDDTYTYTTRSVPAGTIAWEIKSKDEFNAVNATLWGNKLTWEYNPVGKIQNAMKVVVGSTAYGFEQLAQIADKGKSTYSVKLDANNVVTGFGIVADGTTKTSSVVFKADNFYITNDTTSNITIPTGTLSPNNNTLPFGIQDGKLYMKNAFIKQSQIIDLNVGSVTLQQAVTAGGTLTSGNIRTDHFVSGWSGWQIKYDGTAEFSNLVVRNRNITGGVGRLRGHKISSKTLTVGGWVTLVDASFPAPTISTPYDIVVNAVATVDTGSTEGWVWFKVTCTGTAAATQDDVSSKQSGKGYINISTQGGLYTVNGATRIKIEIASSVGGTASGSYTASAVVSAGW